MSGTPRLARAEDTRTAWGGAEQLLGAVNAAAAMAAGTTTTISGGVSGGLTGGGQLLGGQNGRLIFYDTTTG